MNIAKVVVDVPVAQTNRIYDYLIPDAFIGTIDQGMRVIVPFGPRTIMGYVLAITNHSDLEKLREIKELMDVTPILTEELLSLGKWLANHTMSFYISAFQAMLPQALKANYQKEIHRLTDSSLTKELELIFADRDYITYQEFVKRNGSHQQLKKGIEDGDIEFVYQVNSKETVKKTTYILPKLSSLELEEQIADLPTQAKKKKEILEYFIANPSAIEKRELLKKLRTTDQTIKPLIEGGILSSEAKEVYRNPYRDDQIVRTEPLPLMKQQKEAIEPILEALDQKKHHVFLLHGVTGSGKTEIYLQAIAHTLIEGKESIVLVPEISLTPQMVKRFKGRFGSAVAVMHSALSNGERFDEWRKVQRKEVKVVVGARSAIFAPFENIGLIIIDEEHETTYKQEDHPRYHVRDVAIERARNHHCPVILGSATPTLESFARAQKGVYRLLSMPHRMNEGEMPKIHIADMRKELHAGNRTMFSRQLKEAIEERLEKKEQIVLFLNRRGYSTFVMCRDCGHVIECPHCDISLTYHRNKESLKCHYCSYEEKMPACCPECQSETIRYFGTGTQKVEETLQELIPGASVIRMDVDTTRRKGAHERLLDQFANKQADILLGTQMIAKGLDFANVTLVGVLAADSLLNLPDFRSAEKTFQLLTQVSGRAGRHHLEGEVIIQTYMPEHYSVELAANYNYLGFFQKEMELRKTYQYPPYYFLTLITVSHPNQLKALEITRTIGKLLYKHLSNHARILGPTPSPLVRVKDRYRFQCMIKYKNEPNQQKVLERILSYYESAMRKEDLLIQIDLQPYQLM
ncbi:primosomal protein N' (replication factor Y) [Natronobacillus azotifigens]|uniref:Replication restart protein PriA n=1 Tax=Natronobacillus azotifigens TaxID=472978 RepID=A0A9J6RDV7_9BACI|nr:primosomal protein N' [Natronobacillus azotifigens]